MSKTHIITASGFECDIDEETINDAELLDLICELDGDVNVMAFPKICKKLLGEAKTTLYDHLRTDDGRVPFEKLGDEIGEIIKGLNSKKK